jgi:hypothetical protein
VLYTTSTREHRDAASAFTVLGFSYAEFRDVDYTCKLISSEVKQFITHHYEEIEYEALHVST